MSFSQHFAKFNWDDIRLSIYAKTQDDVRRALAKARPGLEDFKALISPAAEPFLEQMAQRSKELTQQRFGRTIQLYIPLYLSSMCSNICTYCGFSMGNKIRRVTLDMEQVKREIAAIKRMGFDHILIVTGESERKVGMSYFREAIALIKANFNHVSMEVQPLEQEEYAELKDLGLDAVMVYQETYNRFTYAEHHLKGKKTNFDYRLETGDRIGKAGVHKIGIGALIGLDDWRTESFHVAAHLEYLERTYWQMRTSISFPRLRPCEGYSPKSVMTDRQLLQLICAYRIFNNEVELSLSTRESEHFRNNVLPLGITTMSAASSTQPGGYADPSDKTLEQFEISDDRTANEVAAMIKAQGYEAVWKDWDRALA